MLGDVILTVTLMLPPLSPSDWNKTTAAHLIKRAGFGACPEDVAKLTTYGLDRAVSWFVDYENQPDDTSLPQCSQPDPNLIPNAMAIKNETDPQKKQTLFRELRKDEYRQMIDMRYWWVSRMATGPRPFQEKMTLFWHGHFATSFEKVRVPFVLFQQNQIFRRLGTGHFFDLLSAVSKDPAMLIYLDGATSKVAHPNENFAREVMELFTLGEGHYTEKDIQESARAYTGWSLGPGRQGYQYRPIFHDNGIKTFLGQTGNFDGDACLKILSEQEQTSKFIAWKLWRFFVQDPAPDESVDALATVMRNNHMDLKEAMRTLFMSQAFYSRDVIRTQVKSPVQWLVSALRELQSPVPSAPLTLVMLNSLGQNLFEPPNVKGWDGGFAWITTSNLLNRQNFASALVEGTKVNVPSLNGTAKGVQRILNQTGDVALPPISVAGMFSKGELQDPDKFVQALEGRFLNGQLAPSARQTLHDFAQLKLSTPPMQDDDIRKALRLMLSTPDYQLT